MPEVSAIHRQTVSNMRACNIRRNGGGLRTDRWAQPEFTNPTEAMILRMGSLLGQAELRKRLDDRHLRFESLRPYVRFSHLSSVDTQTRPLIDT